MPFLANAHNLASLHQNLNIPTSNVLWWRGHAHTINVAMFTLGPHFNAHSKINSGPVLIPLNKLENFKACGWFSFFRGYYSQRMVSPVLLSPLPKGKRPLWSRIYCLLPVASGVPSRVQGWAKNLATFSDTCSVRADWLCIGSPRLVGGRKAGNSNKQEFFLHHAVYL